MMKNKRGFTLVEMLVVICIILILAAALAMLIRDLIKRSRVKATQSEINILSAACDEYKREFAQFPPIDIGSSIGAMCLHLHLGSPRYYLPYNVTSGPAAPAQNRPPYVEFKTLWLEGYPANLTPNPAVNIIDAWTNPITYATPGVNNKTSVDISSGGPDPTDPTVAVTNWIRDQ